MKKKAKVQHTAGPWTAEKSNTHGYWVTGPDGAGITTACYGRGDDIDAANAYIIAAVPDLLTKLEELTAFVAEDSARYTPEDREVVAQRLVREARATIAKARGDAQ